MIIRSDMNEPGDTFHQVKIDLDTELHHQKIRAVVYPNYCDRVKLKINSVGLGFEIHKEQAKDLIEVLQAALRACE